MHYSENERYIVGTHNNKFSLFTIVFSEINNIIWMCQHLFNHSFIIRHLDFFQLSSIVHVAKMDNII